MRGFWVAAGFCAHGLAGAGGHGQARRRVDRRGHAVARRLAHGLAPLRRAPIAAASTRSRARRRSTRRTTTSSTRVTSGRPGGRCASRRRTRDCRSSAPPSARSPAGSARTGSSRTPRAATSRCARAAGRGSSGRPRSAPSTSRAARRRRSSTRASFAKIEVCGEGAADLLERLCAQPRRPRRRPGDVHADAQPARRDRVRLHRDAARRGSLPHRHGHGVRPARPRVDRASTRPTTARSTSRRDVAYACFGLWGPRAREILAAADDDRPLERGVPVHAGARARGRARPVPRAARDVRRRARLGALLPSRVRARALGHDLGGRQRARARRRRLQGDRLAAAREGLPRVGRRHHARGHAVRGGTRLRREARQGRLHRPRGARLRATSRSGCSAA